LPGRRLRRAGITISEIYLVVALEAVRACSRRHLGGNDAVFEN
jgi:hypothetical protein